MSVNEAESWSITDLPNVVDVPDQPCSQLYENHPVLLGYDVVQYHFIPSFKQGGVPVRGKPKYAYNFQNYQFWFMNRENRERFISDPWKYAPAWGGFCSYGIALELAPQWPWATDFLGPPASPWEGWIIVDEVLMFNIWSSYSDLFLAGGQTNIDKAIARWKGFWGKELHAGPFNTHCIGHGSLKNWCTQPPQPDPWNQPLPPLPANCTEPFPENNNSNHVDDNITFTSTNIGRNNTGRATKRNFALPLVGSAVGVGILVVLVVVIYVCKRSRVCTKAQDSAKVGDDVPPRNMGGEAEEYRKDVLT